MAITTALRARKPAHKLTPTRIIKACRSGAVLCLRHGAKPSYSLQPPGTAVPVKYALASLFQRKAGSRTRRASSGAHPIVGAP